MPMCRKQYMPLDGGSVENALLSHSPRIKTAHFTAPAPTQDADVP